jgi:Fe-S-cluster containining protein
VEDARLIKDEIIEKHNLYTIRVGELVSDNIHNRLRITEREIIKIKEKEEANGCIYYDEGGKACKIYDHRPIQCSALACWDEREFMWVYKGPKLNRQEIIHDKILLGLIERHEKKCSYREIERLVKQIEEHGEKAVERILELLRFDYELRSLVAEKMGIESGEMNFIFGRPLIETITMYGLQVTRESDDSFFLTVHQS